MKISLSAPSHDPDDPFRGLHRVTIQWLYAMVRIRREMMASMPGHGFRYSCPEEMVLFDGVATYTRIEDCRFPEMQIGNCFANAFTLTLLHPELRYCEGWANMEQSIPTHHAWVMHPDGSISDPTWLGMVREVREGKRGDTVPGWNGRGVYLGITLPRNYHLAWFHTHGTPNLLSMGEMTDPEVLALGYEAYTRRQVRPDRFPEAIADALSEVAETPQWQLAPDGKSYTRTRKDGKVERWVGEHAGIEVIG